MRKKACRAAIVGLHWLVLQEGAEERNQSILFSPHWVKNIGKNSESFLEPLGLDLCLINSPFETFSLTVFV